MNGDTIGSNDKDTEALIPSAGAPAEIVATNIGSNNDNDKPSFVQLVIGGNNAKNKRRRRDTASNDSEQQQQQSPSLATLRDEFGGTTAADEFAQQQQSVTRTQPLVIPATRDELKWKKRATGGVAAKTSPGAAATATAAAVKREDDEEEADAAAVRALEEEAGVGSAAAAAAAGAAADGANNSNNVVIALSRANNNNNNNSNSNTAFVVSSAAAATLSEQQQYRQDLAALPRELDETADAYRRVPIAEFGAALLRGMGWNDKDEESNNKANGAKKGNDDDDVVAFPRPHRLGLGAMPAADRLPESATPGRGRRPDQFQRDRAARQQQEAYRAERERQLAADKQRTLQNGSLVLLLANGGGGCGGRARIVKLAGVPGLNRVQVQREREAEPSILERSAIDRLLTRQELDAEPFIEAAAVAAAAATRKRNERNGKNSASREGSSGPKGISSDDKRSSERDGRSGRDKERARRDDEDDGRGRSREDDRSKKKGRQQQQEPPAVASTVWLIPNIRVRVVTEKLGRRYYKEKGVVVDVTSAGATLQMTGSGGGSSAAVLDRVRERHLETALPAVGGSVIVLAGPRKFAKGRLLERDSRRGVVQVFEDMSCATLPLDSLAEWCGPLDDALG